MFSSFQMSEAAVILYMKKINDGYKYKTKRHLIFNLSNKHSKKEWGFQAYKLF